jgi:hypothetical protein
MAVKRIAWQLLFVGLLVGLSTSAADAQRQRRTGTGGNAGGPKLPADPRLLELHKQFVIDAERLALEYQAKGELDKARACYQEVLRLVPGYGKAEMALQKIRTKETSAMRKTMEISSSKGWQDTGLDVVEGKPVLFRADGHWKMVIDYEVSPDGIEIPKELRRFNLGCLIGIVMAPGEGLPGESKPDVSAEAAAAEGTPVAEKPAGEATAANTESAGATEGEKSAEEEEPKEPRPFFIGSQRDWTAKRSGRLYLRMYDANPTDNAGKMIVSMNGTFASPPNAK